MINSHSILRSSVALVAVCTVTVLAGRASADNIVLESYGGTRPSDAEGLVGPVRAAMRARGFDAGASLSKRIEARLSHRANVLSSGELASARRFVRSGRKQYINGRFDNAMKDLSHGTKLLLDAPATMARTQSSRAILRDALVYMALVESQRGATQKARGWMAELVRTFPDTPINVARYGPSARTLFLSVKRSLTNQGLGTLTVNVDDPAAVSFLNERYVGGGSVTVRGLHAGRYRLYLQRGETPGRVREVNIAAGGNATVDVAWSVDGSLRTEGTLVGVVFPDAATQLRDEAATVIRVARAVRASGVAVVRVTSEGGSRAVSGAFYSLDSNKPIRTASIDVDPVKPDAGKLRVLGRFLSGDKEAAKQIAKLDNRRGARGKAGGKTGTKAHGTRNVARPYKTWKWVALLGGVTMLAGGGALIAMDVPEFTGGIRNADARNTKTPGIIAAAVGGVLTLTGAYLWVRDRKDARRGGVAVVPTVGGAALTFGGSF